ncbi:MAG: hypothetical protein JW772_04180 [Candidatus Diapherotrites archaeon]|nr:hypothetical protein [Candidatus Diapherotrites archaeon]
MSLLKIIRESFVLLGKKPKLFVPKILVALLYGMTMLFAAQFVMFYLPEIQEIMSQFNVYLESGAATSAYGGISVSNPLLFVVYDLGLIFLMFFTLAFDVFTNAMYPTMIKDYFSKKPISFSRAAGLLKGKILKILLTILIIEVIFLVPLATLSVLLFFAGNYLVLFILMIIILLVILILSVVLYFVYPLLVFESVFFFSTIKRSWQLARAKAPKIVAASFIPFFISLFNIFLAFLAVNSLGFLLIFFLFRFLIAVTQTYHMVLNPSIFLRYREL